MLRVFACQAQTPRPVAPLTPAAPRLPLPHPRCVCTGIATIHFPTENELDCTAIGTMIYIMISRLDLQKEAGMPWKTIGSVLGVTECLVPSYWLPADYDGDGCFHDETSHAVYAGLANAPNDEVMLALWDWGCANDATVRAALKTIFAEGMMGADKLGTAFTGMVNPSAQKHFCPENA